MTKDELLSLKQKVDFCHDRLAMLAAVSTPTDPAERAKIGLDHDIAWNNYRRAVDAYQTALASYDPR
jgi:hypothetical protein